MGWQTARVSIAGVVIAVAALIALDAIQDTQANHTPDTSQRTVTLFLGCNPVALTYPGQTPVADVLRSVTLDVPGTPVVVWRFDAASGRFAGASSAAPQAGDLPTANFLDSAFICVQARGAMTMPQATPAPGTRTLGLVKGCNPVASTFDDLEGVSIEVIFNSITVDVPGSVAVWRLNAGRGVYEGASAAAPQFGDLDALAFLDSVMVCTQSSGTLSLPNAYASPVPFTIFLQGREPSDIVPGVDEYMFIVTDVSRLGGPFGLGGDMYCLGGRARITDPTGKTMTLPQTRGGFVVPPRPAVAHSFLGLLLPLDSPAGVWQISVTRCDGRMAAATFLVP